MLRVLAVSDLRHLVPTLFDTPDGLGPVGDELGRCYTPLPLAAAIVRAIEGPVSTALEPSVGGGAFVRALRARWPDVQVRGVDVDANAVGLGLCAHHCIGDWPTVARFWGRVPVSFAFPDRQPPGSVPWRPQLVIGNPPFGRAVGIEVTIAHVLASLDVVHGSGTVVQLLPLPYLCGSEFDVVWRRERPSIVHRVVGRPWPTRLREVAVFEWRGEWDGPTEVRDLEGWPA